MARPRIDLDGVALVDEADPHMVVAIFRYRTTEGLVFLIPESADVLVRWGEIQESFVDLYTGTVRVRLAPTYADDQSWLRGARQLVGRWTDRMVLRGTDLPGPSEM